MKFSVSSSLAIEALRAAGSTSSVDSNKGENTKEIVKLILRSPKMLIDRVRLSAHRNMRSVNAEITFGLSARLTDFFIMRTIERALVFELSATQNKKYLSSRLDMRHYTSVTAVRDCKIAVRIPRVIHNKLKYLVDSNNAASGTGKTLISLNGVILEAITEYLSVVNRQLNLAEMLIQSD